MDLDLAKIERQFDRAAATYDSVAALQRTMGERLLSSIPVDFSQSLLDLGCGTGEMLFQLSQRTSAQLTGVDLSSAMLQRAAQRSPKATFVKADLCRLPFADSSFDCVVSNAAIQWCDQRTAFAEARRVLRPGGSLFVSTFGIGTMSQWQTAVLAADGDDRRVHSFAVPQQLVDVLNEGGFDPVRFTTESIDLTFDSVATMLDSVRKLGATNARLDRPAGLSGRDWYRRFVDELGKQRSPDGRLTLTYECVFLSGVRTSG